MDKILKTFYKIENQMRCSVCQWNNFWQSVNCW